MNLEIGDKKKGILSVVRCPLSVGGYCGDHSGGRAGATDVLIHFFRGAPQ